jgi:lysozyme family protein
METKFGISRRSYPNLDIKNLTIEQAADIYIRDYLAPLKADKLPGSVTFQLLDFAINSGVDRAVVCLQRAVGAVEDGRMGPATVAAVKRYTEAEVIMRLLAERLEFMSGLSVWPTFGRCWCRRIAANLRYGAEDLS